MVRLPPARLTVALALVMLLSGCATLRSIDRMWQSELNELVCVRDPIHGDIICTTETVHPNASPL